MFIPSVDFYMRNAQAFISDDFLLCHQVAQFLRVNPETGLFFFDSSYRPVPLAQQYIGISEQNFAARIELLNEICYKKVSFHLSSALNRSNLVMVVNLLHLALLFEPGC